jgi:hypothetical protein
MTRTPVSFHPFHLPMPSLPLFHHEICIIPIARTILTRPLAIILTHRAIFVNIVQISIPALGMSLLVQPESHSGAANVDIGVRVLVIVPVIADAVAAAGWHGVIFCGEVVVAGEVDGQGFGGAALHACDILAVDVKVCWSVNEAQQ